MNSFLYNGLDKVNLGIALVILAWVATSTWKKTSKSTPLGVLLLLFLGPVFLMTSMVFHLYEVTHHAFASKFTGMFSLRFRLYSLLLLGILLGNAGVYFFLGVKSFVISAKPSLAMVLKPASGAVLILFPLLWITPFSFIYIAECAISIGTAILAHKNLAQKNNAGIFATV